MKATIDLPMDLAREINLRASAEGREVEDTIVDLVREGLAASKEPVPDVFATSSAVKTDPSTGLPFFECALDAPISRVSSGEIIALIHLTQEKEDLERIGVTVRR